MSRTIPKRLFPCLNAPFGALCFLTKDYLGMKELFTYVLMHLMALCAF